MAQVQYKVDTGATPINSSGSVQTVLAVLNSCTDAGLQLKKYRISMSGVTAANAPLPVRLFYSDGTTAGTAGTTPAVTLVSGLSIVSTNIAGGAFYSAEPTNKTYFDGFLLTPNAGTVIYDYFPGDEPNINVKGTAATAIGIEVGAGTAVGISAAMVFTRI